MSDAELPDEPSDASSDAAPVAQQKGRRSFNAVRRELSEDELATPGVQKLLLDELDRLERELRDSQGYRERFSEADKRAAVLEEKFKTYTSVEIVSMVCLAAGSLMVGLVPSAWSSQPAAAMVLILGLLLLAAAIFAKRIRL